MGDELGPFRDRFTRVGLLGEGSFGRVLAVRAREGGAEYALKILALQGDGRREARELELATRVDHPGVVRTLETRIEAGVAFLLMEKAEGSLASLLADPARSREAWQALVQAAEGVGAMHAAGLVHRDLKPANILLFPDRAKVSDLGLARELSTGTLTATGTILGTPAYMAPEQARGERATAASDRFALGVMFYEVVEGRLPWPARTGVDLLSAVARCQVAGFARGKSRLGAATRGVLEALLAADPAGRPGAVEDWLPKLEPPGEGTASGGTEATGRFGTPGRADATREMGAGGPGGSARTAVLAKSGPGAGAGAGSSSRASVPAAGSADRVGSGSRGASLRSAAILVVAIAAAFAFFFGYGLGGSPGGPGPSASPRGLPPDLLDRLEAEFEAARAASRGAEGPVRGGTTGAPTLTQDPARWPGLVIGLPVLKEAIGLLVQASVVAALGPGERARLVEFDARFREATGAGPLGPLLDTPPEPAPRSLDPEVREWVRQQKIWIDLEEPRTGYPGAMIRELEALARSAAALDEELARGCRGGPTGDVLEQVFDATQASRTVLALGEFKLCKDAIRAAPDSPVMRESLARWVSGFQETVHRYLVAAARTAETAPHEGQLVGCTTNAFVSDFFLYWRGHRTTGDLEALVGPVTRHPLLEYLAGRWAQTGRRAMERFSGWQPGLLVRAGQRFAGYLAAPGLRDLPTGISEDALDRWIEEAVKEGAVDQVASRFDRLAFVYLRTDHRHDPRRILKALEIVRTSRPGLASLSRETLSGCRDALTAFLADPPRRGDDDPDPGPIMAGLDRLLAGAE